MSNKFFGGALVVALAAGATGCGTTASTRVITGPAASVHFESDATYPTYFRSVDKASCPVPDFELVAVTGGSSAEVLAGLPTAASDRARPVRTADARVDADKPLYLQAAMGNDLCVVTTRVTPQAGRAYVLRFTILSSRSCQIEWRRIAADGKTEEPDPTARQIKGAVHAREICE